MIICYGAISYSSLFYLYMNSRDLPRFVEFWLQIVFPSPPPVQHCNKISNLNRPGNRNSRRNSIHQIKHHPTLRVRPSRAG